LSQSQQVRYLSLNEIARFGIDPREFHESRWMTDEGPPGPLAVVKFVVEAKGSAPKDYRTTRIRLTCGRPEELRVELSREVPSLDRPASIAVTTRGDAFVLAPPRNKPVPTTSGSRIGSRACPSPSSRMPRRAMPSRSRKRRISPARQDCAAIAALARRFGGVDRHSGETVPPVSSVRMVAALACGLACKDGLSKALERAKEACDTRQSPAA